MSLNQIKSVLSVFRLGQWAAVLLNESVTTKFWILMSSLFRAKIASVLS